MSVLDHTRRNNIKKKNISAGVPQGNILATIIFLLYTADIPINNYSIIVLFSDDTAIMVTDDSEFNMINQQLIIIYSTKFPTRRNIGKSKSTVTNWGTYIKFCVKVLLQYYCVNR